MKSFSKKTFILVAAIISALCFTAGIVFGTAKPIVAEETSVSVKSIRQTYFQPYNGASFGGGDYTYSSLFVIEFQTEETDLFSGYAVGTEISDADLSNFKANTVWGFANKPLSTSHFKAKITKYAENTVRLYVNRAAIWSNFFFGSGITVCGKTLTPSNWYEQEDWTFSTETPSSPKITGVYEGTLAGDSADRIRLCIAYNTKGSIANTLFGEQGITVNGKKTEYNTSGTYTGAESVIPVLDWSTDWDSPGQCYGRIVLPASVMTDEGATITFPAGLKLGSWSTGLAEAQTFSIGYDPSNKTSDAQDQRVWVENKNAISVSAITQTKADGYGHLSEFTVTLAGAAGTDALGDFGTGEDISSYLFEIRNCYKLLWNGKRIDQVNANKAVTAVKTAENTLKITIKSDVQYSAFTIKAGLRLGSKMTTDDVVLYEKQDWSFGTTAPSEIAVFAVYPIATGASGKSEHKIVFNMPLSATITDTDKILINGTSVKELYNRNSISQSGETVYSGTQYSTQLTISDLGASPIITFEAGLTTSAGSLARTQKFIADGRSFSNWQNLPAYREVTDFEEISVTGVTFGGRQPNNSAANYGTDYLITLDADADVLSSYAAGDEITSAETDIGALIKLNGVALSGVAGGYKAFKEGANVLRIRNCRPIGNAVITIPKGLFLGNGYFGAEYVYYWNKDGTFGTVEPAYAINTVFEIPYDNATWSQMELCTNKSATMSSSTQFYGVKLNGENIVDSDGNVLLTDAVVASAAGTISYGNDWDAGSSGQRVHLYFSRTVLDAGAMLYFPAGFGFGSYSVLEAQAFAVPYGTARDNSAYSNMPVWTPVYGEISAVFSKISDTKFSLAFSATDLNGSVIVADIFSAYAENTDITASVKADAVLSSVIVNGTAIGDYDGITVKKGSANQVIIELEDYYETVNLSLHGGQIYEDLWIAESADLEVTNPLRVIGYKDVEGNLYKTRVSGTSAVTLDFGIVNGVEFRLALPTGIRWISRVLTSDLAAGYVDEYGTMISTVETLSGAELTFDNVTDGENALIIKSTVSYINDDYTYFNGVVSNIKETNYNKTYVGRGYFKVVYYDESFEYFYTDTVERVPSAVALAAYNDIDDVSVYPEEVIAVIKKMAGIE